MIEDDRELRRTLFGALSRDGESPLPLATLPTVLDQYRLYLELADQISHRRQSANSFFVGVNTALVGVLGYALGKAELSPLYPLLVFLSVAGVFLCLLWYRIIRSYRDLNTAKFAVVHQIETVLPLRPYTAEWEYVGRGHVSRLYRPITHIEIAVPWLFAALYIVGFVWILAGA